MDRAAAAIGALLGTLGCGALASASDLPPLGRSLFDHLTTQRIDGRVVQRVPYPFQALLAQLQARAGTDSLGRPGIAAVLIPMGRSLQRNASADDYFRHPRVVIAITGEARAAHPAAALLKDRLFLGFQDESGIVEVISYNESAGRFEFQIVSDYRAGATPHVVYARRAVCTTCHHGGGPIFSRPSWDETNANPAVARALAAHAKSFHGVAVARGVDVPNAIDDAVARANRIALVQAIWRQGCGRTADPAQCRADALLGALGLRLSAASGAPMRLDAGTEERLQPLMAAWRTQWPHGLAEPDPNIPNRDPFLGEAQHLASGALRLPYAADEIGPQIDPMTPRDPVAFWRADGHGLERFLRSLGDMFAASDIGQLAHRSAAMPGASGARALTPQAAVSPRFDSEHLQRALQALAADARAGRTEALGSIVQRVPTVRALLAQLGHPGVAVCCDTDDARFPPPRIEREAEPQAAVHTSRLRPFFEHCAVCHGAPAASPPGFLAGSGAAVEGNLRRCAPRIRYRLAMWQTPEGTRPKLPMPPPVFVPSWRHAPPREDLARMLQYVDEALDPGLRDGLLMRKYETLPICRATERAAARAP